MEDEVGEFTGVILFYLVNKSNHKMHLEQHLDDIYLDAYNEIVTRLNDLWHTNFESCSSNPESKFLWIKFISGISPEFRLKYNSAGDAFALVRFEKVFTNFLDTFDLLSFDEILEKAKEEFLDDWNGHTNYPLIEAFIGQPDNVLVCELGQYKAWRDFGFESIREESVLFPYDDYEFEDDSELETDATNEKIENHEEEKAITTIKSSKTIKETAFDEILKKNKRLTKFLWKTEDWKVLMELHKQLKNNNYISSISFKEFETHFKGQAFGSKIIWNKSKEELLYLLDNLTEYMEDKTINKKGTVNPWFAFHFLVSGKRISTTSEIYEARRAYKNTNKN
jgi:hypothetical protein